MATKPGTTPQIWAANGVYTTGPFIGSSSVVDPGAGIAAEGHRPGANFPTAAEHQNYEQFWVTTWVTTWLALGSSAGAADAHIVEAGADGRFQIEGIDVVPANAIAGGLTVQAPPTVGNAMRVTGGNAAGSANVVVAPSGSSPGIVVDASATSGLAAQFLADGSDCVSVTTTGITADGIVVTTSGDGSDGVRVVTSGSAVIAVSGQVDDPIAWAVQGLAVDNGVGGRFFGGQLSGQALTAESFADAAIEAEGGVPGSGAIVGLGKTTASGGYFTGGPGGANGVVGISAGAGTAGVRGEATNATNGVGVVGTTAAGAGSAAIGVHGIGLNDGVGVLGDCLDGVGVRGRSSADGVAVEGVATADGYGGLFTAFGTRSTLRIVQRNSDPTVLDTGGIWNRTSQGLKTFVSSVARFLWHTAGGAAIAWDFSASGTVDDTFPGVLSCTLNGADSPTVSGTVLIWVTVEVGRTGGTPDVNVQVFDVDAGSAPITLTATMYQAGGATVYERTLSYLVPWSITPGDRTFTLAMGSTSAVNTVNYRNAAIAVIGVF